jgi:PIN domain nuclease of toxin-antitoxin system
MRIILDTHFVIGILNGTLEAQYPRHALRLSQDDVESIVSVASLWEIAIKSRLGKLNVQAPLPFALQILVAQGFAILPVEAPHVTAPISPELQHRDPFDRLLLGQCAATNAMLMTVDTLLVDHPLAVKLNAH